MGTFTHISSGRRGVEKLTAIGVLIALIAAVLIVLLFRAYAPHRRPRPVPKALLWGKYQLQLPSEGVGTLFHRRYSLLIDQPRMSERELMDHIKAELSALSPRPLADFKKVSGDPDVMQLGDEYDIEILGPWNGGVRVTEVTNNSFTFVTLEGHPEAGQITFALTSEVTHPNTVRFEINSWARSRDMVVSLTYEHMGGIGKEIQKNAWVSFCENVAAASGGSPAGEVEVITEERDSSGKVVPLV